MKKTFSLNQILPAKPEFYIASRKKVYEVRPPNLQDHTWLENKFGSVNAIAEAMNANNWEIISQVVYRLLTLDGQRDFKAHEHTFFDDDGVEHTEVITGSRTLIKSLGVGEAVPMLQALTKAITLSNPIVEKAVRDELKKNPQMRIKKA